MAILTIPQLSSTTPTLAETMRACFLRAGFSQAQGSRAYVLSNPKAWLGIAYHEVLEALPAIALKESESSVRERADARWKQAISRLEHQAALHSLDRRFGPALRWKGYYLVLETLRIRVDELVELLKVRGHETETRGDESSVGASPEKAFSALAGQLRGRIDLLRGDEIIDYKTGSLFDSDTDESEPSLKVAYLRQLHIYSYLAHEATGRWPRRGLLFPLAGPAVIVDLEPSDCQKEAEEAVNLLKFYNRSIATALTASDIASPSPEACRWCPFKIICPAFWTSASEPWSGILDDEAIAGRLLSAPLAIHGGAAWSIRLMVDAGTATGEVVIAPLGSSLHSSVVALSEGERVRIVGLGRRTNGSLFPTQRTVVLADVRVPPLRFEDRKSDPHKS